MFFSEYNMATLMAGLQPATSGVPLSSRKLMSSQIHAIRASSDRHSRRNSSNSSVRGQFNIYSQ